MKFGVRENGFGYSEPIVRRPQRRTADHRVTMDRYAEDAYPGGLRHSKAKLTRLSRKAAYVWRGGSICFGRIVKYSMVLGSSAVGLH